MSINDPQWGNSHRPEENQPEQVPDVTGTEPVQPEDGAQGSPHNKTPDQPPTEPQRPPPSRPPEGPPDLEELWQQLVYQLRCRLARLLGRELPQPPAAPAILVNRAQPSDVDDDAALSGWQALSLKSWLIGVSLIIGAWLVSGFYLVDTPQRGVLSRFGSVIAVEDPGWHWRWPYPIESVRLINVTADRSLEVGLSAQKDHRQAQGLMLTADNNLIGVAYAIVYQVTDPVAYLLRADTPTDVLALLTESSLRDAIAGQTLATMLAVGSKSTASVGDAMLQTVRSRLQAALDPLQLGIEVKNLEIREVQLPAPVLQSVKDAERDEQAQAKALRDAQSTATENLIKARKLAAKIQDESMAYARLLDNEAQGLLAPGVGRNAEQARQALGEKAAKWREQYPLLFAGPGAMQEKLQPSVAAVGKKDVGGKVTAPVAGEWRDRDIMRSRDRVDRPGSGS